MEQAAPGWVKTNVIFERWIMAARGSQSALDIMLPRYRLKRLTIGRVYQQIEVSQTTQRLFQPEVAFPVAVAKARPIQGGKKISDSRQPS
jgi:hypothetical protein